MVLVTIGSLGDLHPFIAIGIALKQRGHRVLLAIPEDHLAKARAAGLDAQAIMPSFETIRQTMGVDSHDAAVRIMSDQRYLMDKVLMPSVADSVAALDPLLESADLVVGSLFAFAAGIAAEKRGLPLVNVVLQPMTLFSEEDPPRTPQFRVLAGPNPGLLGKRWNALVYRLIRSMLRRRYAGRIDAIRRDNGLPPSSDALLLDGGRTAALSLCCYSPILAPLPPDAPARTEVIGFPFFDSDSGAPNSSIRRWPRFGRPGHRHSSSRWVPSPSMRRVISTTRPKGLHGGSACGRSC
jgi:rhamnosyltransferase subunit B